MGRTVAEFLDTTSAREIEEWIIFERFEAEDERKAYEAAERKSRAVDPGDDEEF